MAGGLIDQGEVQRLASCPPHLAEQWQAEMRDKFHLEEARPRGHGGPPRARPPRRRSLFERYPITVVSMDTSSRPVMWRRSSTLLPSSSSSTRPTPAPTQARVAGEGISATSW